MKFVSLIASTLLIVLVSQHSSTALPINEWTTEEPCLEGFERVDGHCVEVKANLHFDQVESSSPLVKSITLSDVKVRLQSDEPKRFGACPKGMERGEHGICQEVISHDQPAITIEPKEGHEESLEVTYKPSHVTVEPLDATSEPFEVTEVPSDVTHEPLELTSEKSDVDDGKEGEDTIRKSSPVEVPKGCPSGTKADEDGACQDIKQTSTKKTLTDLKIFLNKDGSCPEDMKKIDGRCMYVRSKFMAKINQNFATINDDDLAASRTRVTNDKNGEYELVAVLPDNSCPNGTEYSAYGVCHKRIRPSSFSTFQVSKPECPEDQVFVGGRCILKKVEVLLPSDVTTKVSKSSNTAPKTEQSEDDESPKSTPKLTIIKDTPVEA